MTVISARALIPVLVLCSAVQPFALNVLAPATPAIARAVGSDYGTIQLTLTVYLATVALAQLLVGPLSDRIGRRPCIVGGLALFTVGSLVGIIAQGLPMMLAARILQAAGAGTAFALSRAAARDIGGRDEAASIIGYVTMAMVVAPMIAPLVGGTIETWFGWRAIFGAMALTGAVATLGAWLRLPETRPPGALAGGWLDTVAALPVLAQERAFVAHAVGLAFTSTVFFIFIAGAPFVVVEHLGAGAKVYGLLFMTLSASYMAGNFLTGRFSQRFGADRLARFGNVLSFAGVALAALLALTPSWSAPLVFFPMMLNGLGNGLSIPTLTASALSVRPELAGSASGLAGFLQLGLGAVGAWLSGLVTPSWPPAFLMMMFVCSAIALVAPRISRGR
jgi:DHA1 family bicyclomycin/chloramphenicol resistance-like MFS transporter